MMSRPWVAFFSQTGAEISDIAKSLNKWPDYIVTNKRPENLRTIDPRIIDNVEDRLIILENKPSVEEYFKITKGLKHPIITLHGWLRIVPPEFIERYPHSIYNGHPGLITEYPELKGKDPQIRAYEGKYPVAGTVIHRVTAGVDEGKVIAEERFNNWNLELDDLFRILRDRSLYLWCNFLKKVL